MKMQARRRAELLMGTVKPEFGTAQPCPARLPAPIITSMATAADEKRLYKIGEVCRIADVQPYVLRYWETEFASLAPNKSGGGQRLYTQREIDIVLRIKQLLYSEGFTIAGAKKKLDAEAVEPAAAPVTAAPRETAEEHVAAVQRSDDARKALLEVRQQLNDILAMLDRQ
jgi:DNA-binding transcriptional MerR regulator